MSVWERLIVPDGVCLWGLISHESNRSEFVCYNRREKMQNSKQIRSNLDDSLQIVGVNLLTVISLYICTHLEI